MISHSYIFQCCVTDSTHWGQASQWPIASCRWNCCGKPCFVWHFVMRTIPSYMQWRSRKSFFPTSWLRQTCFVFFVLCRCLYSAECPANFHCKGKLLFEQLMYWIPLDYSDDVSKVCFAASSTPSRIFFSSLSLSFFWFQVFKIISGPGLWPFRPKIEYGLWPLPTKRSQNR